MIEIYLDGGVSLRFSDVLYINLYGGSSNIIFRYKRNGETLEASFNKEKIVGYTISGELA